MNLLNKKQFGLVLSRTEDIGTPCLSSSVKNSYWLDIVIKGEIPHENIYSDTDSMVSDTSFTSDSTINYDKGKNKINNELNNIISISCNNSVNNSADNSDDEDNIGELDLVITKKITKFNISDLGNLKVKRTKKSIRQSNKNFMKLMARFRLYDSNKQHNIKKLVSIGKNNGYDLEKDIVLDLKNNYIELY
jgi:hypothetical protein